MDFENIKIDEPMKVGNVIFRKGLSLSTVINAAKRRYRDWTSTDKNAVMPEIMSPEDIANVEKLLPSLPNNERKYVPVHLYLELQRELALVQNNLVAYPPPTFQQRVSIWVQTCFGTEVRQNKVERDYRFFEEACELIQARGNMNLDDAIRVLTYVYNREKGETFQEIGGVMTCLAALVATERTAAGQDVDMLEAGETELTRIWGKISAIREKQKGKPRDLPTPTPRLYADD
jgi:hypothetical protein